MIHLHAHSHYSLLSGTIPLRDLVLQAKSCGHTALALTDDNGLYGAVEFYKICQEMGVRPVIGADLRAPDGRAVFLARNNEGYSALCRLVTAFHEEPDFTLSAALPKFARDLFILVRSPRLVVQLAELNRDYHLGLPPVWALIERMDTRESREEEMGLLQAARANDIPLVAGNDVHFLRPEHHRVHRVLRAIDEQATLEDVEKGRQLPRLVSKEAWYKSDRQMRELFADLPEAIRNTERIAGVCEVELPLGQVEFPDFPAPEGESAFSYLWKNCFKGARQRYGNLSPAVIERLNHELAVIRDMHLSAYFLIVWDIVQFCQRERIPCVGRGSAADSLVVYVLGITHGCPLEHELYFERFLNRERRGAPDIDLDLCWRRRDDVLDYVYERYGQDRVAMICTHVTFCARSALREVSKVFGLPEPEISRLTGAIPHYTRFEEVEKDRSRYPELQHLRFDEPLYREIFDLARFIGSSPRHIGAHPCGIVVSPRPLAEKAPLEIAPKGLQVTQYDMYGVEDIGLLKIDLLGMRSLSVIADVTERAREDYKRNLQLNGLLPYDDDVYRMINEGRTVGCFQLESPGMRQLLQKLNVTDLETLIASISVIRPGPNDAGMMRHFVDRHNGMEEARYLDKRLEPVLQSTYGILLYQEDVLKVASVMAGMSLGEADVFRRAMTKLRTPENMEANRKRFMDGALSTGTAPDVARELWRQVAGFAGYAFCKAHSVSYGILAYQSAYLKQHFPAEFMKAVINNGGGFYSVAVYVEEARRLGLQILPPCVNESEKTFSAGRDWLRTGLGWVKHLSEKTLERLLEQRQMGGSFVSLADFVERVRPARDELDSLVRCGALDAFGRSRPRLLWQADLAVEKKRPVASGRGEATDLFGAVKAQPVQDVVLPDRESISIHEKLRWEEEVLGFTVSEHPMVTLRRFDRRGRWVRVKDLRNRVGRRVVIAGVIRTLKSTRTREGERMKFITLEDETGLVDVVLFPAMYRRWGAMPSFHRRLVVTGRVSDDHGALTVTGEKVEPLVVEHKTEFR